MCLCFPRHIHSSCSTVMALLCIPVSELVSCTFSTIPICPFLIQSHLLVSTLFLLASSNFLATCIYIFFADHSSTSFTYKCTCSKYTSKEGLELFRLPTMELCFVKKLMYTGSRSAQCNMHDLSHYIRPCNSYVVALMWDYSLMYGWPWKHQ